MTPYPSSLVDMRCVRVFSMAFEDKIGSIAVSISVLDESVDSCISNPTFMNIIKSSPNSFTFSYECEASFHSMYFG